MHSESDPGFFVTFRLYQLVVHGSLDSIESTNSVVRGKIEL